MRCPAGRSSQDRHSGGAGAPPGPKMRSCQELADDRKVYSKRDPSRQPSPHGKRDTYGESAAWRSAKSPRLARRKAPAASDNGLGTIGPRISARHPHSRGEISTTPDPETRRGKEHACPGSLDFGASEAKYGLE